MRTPVGQIGRRPIDAAVIYSRRGWAVFPCHYPVPGGCSCGQPDCGSPGKHPRVPGGFRSATTLHAQVRTWWSIWPRANVAIRTGRDSGLVVIDIDPEHGGDESLEALTTEQGPLPGVRTIQTGSGGRHFYFRHPGGEVRNDSGRRLGPGIDVRGDGGYVIAPPSRHASGSRYAVARHGGVIPEMPDWILALVQPPSRERRVEPMPTEGHIRDASAWARRALDGELSRLRTSVKGVRNETLNRVAFRLGQIIGAGALDEHEIEAILVDNAVSIGLGEREAAATVRSGLTAGESAPRGPRQRREISHPDVYPPTP